MKTSLFRIAAILILLSTSCKKESINTTRITIAESNSNSKIQIDSFYIGQHYGGGIIFWLDTTHQHGLISAINDLTTATAWWNGIVVSTGATAAGIGAGLKNTKKIILSEGNYGSYAAKLCFDYSNESYNDWYLPSKSELNLLYKRKNIIGGFDNVGYWSSTESSLYSGYAWYQDFTFGTQDNLSVDNATVNVRAIRKF